MVKVIKDAYDYNKKTEFIEKIQLTDLKTLYCDCNIQWLCRDMQFAVLNYFINVLVYKIFECGENFDMHDALGEVTMSYQGNTFDSLATAAEFKYLPDEYLDLLTRSMVVYDIAKRYKVEVSADRYRSEINIAYEILNYIKENKYKLKNIRKPYYDKKFALNSVEDLIYNVEMECKLIDGSNIQWSPRMHEDGEFLNVRFECEINIIED